MPRAAEKDARLSLAGQALSEHAWRQSVLASMALGIHVVQSVKAHLELKGF